MQLVTDLDEIQRLTTERHDEFEVMRYLLEINEDIISDEDLDVFVDQLAKPIVDAIDCTQCANCCRSLDVYLEAGDAQRLADGIDVPLDAIMTGYVDRERAEDFGEWGTFKAKPCAFLKGKLCSVYDHRPEACRAYPALTPYFRWSLEDTIEGAALCPIIYNMLDALSGQIDGLYQRDNSVAKSDGG